MRNRDEPEPRFLVGVVKQNGCATFPRLNLTLVTDNLAIYLGQVIGVRCAE